MEALGLTFKWRWNWLTLIRLINSRYIVHFSLHAIPYFMSRHSCSVFAKKKSNAVVIYMQRSTRITKLSSTIVTAESNYLFPVARAKQESLIFASIVGAARFTRTGVPFFFSFFFCTSDRQLSDVSWDTRTPRITLPIRTSIVKLIRFFPRRPFSSNEFHQPQK